jgi:protease PrsW
VVGVMLLAGVRWLDRVEPEPRHSRVHAVLWGATVAVAGALALNALFEASFGVTAAVVVGAPLFEEGLKTLGVWWAIKRNEVDSAVDGIVYAALVATGFAVYEDLFYFAMGAELGTFTEVVIARTLTCFVHPLCTIWVGLSLGRALQRTGTVSWRNTWGLWPGVALHATWNYLSITGGLVVLIPLFGAFLVGTVVALRRWRGQEAQASRAALLEAARSYNISPTELHLFSNWRELLSFRRRLDRTQRRQFDRVHGALVRLVRHRTSARYNPIHEQVLFHEYRVSQRGRFGW